MMISSDSEGALKPRTKRRRLQQGSKNQAAEEEGPGLEAAGGHEDQDMKDMADEEAELESIENDPPASSSSSSRPSEERPSTDGRERPSTDSDRPSVDTNRPSTDPERVSRPFSVDSKKSMEESPATLEKSPKPKKVSISSLSDDKDHRDEFKDHRGELKDRSSDSMYDEDDTMQDMIREMRREIKSLQKRLTKIVDERDEERIEGFQKPFQISSTPFSLEPNADGLIRKYLCRNKFGWITLSIDPEALDEFEHVDEDLDGDDDTVHVDNRRHDKVQNLDVYKRRKDWLNLMASGTIEIRCLAIGEGLRDLKIPNEKCFTLGSISSNGYILGRCGVQGESSSGSTLSSSSWLPSVILYSPFSSDLTSIKHSSWTREFLNHEKIVSISCGTNHVCILTSPPHSDIRIFSLNGILLNYFVCGNGVGLTILSHHRFLYLIEQIGNHLCRQRGDHRYDRRYDHRGDSRDGLNNTHETQPSTNDHPVEPSHHDHHRGPHHGHHRGQHRGRDFQSVYFDIDSSHRSYRITTYIINSVSELQSSSSQSTPGCFVHYIDETNLNLFENDKIEWLGISDEKNLPILTTKNGQVFGSIISFTKTNFIPNEIEQLNLFSQLPGAPAAAAATAAAAGAVAGAVAGSTTAMSATTTAAMIDRIKDNLSSMFVRRWVSMIGGYMSDLLSRSIDKEKSKFYPIETSEEGLTVYLCRDFNEIPYVFMPGDNSSVSMKNNRLFIPYRFPLTLPYGLENNSNEVLPISMSKWSEFFSIDPKLQEQKKSLPWQFWDEIRYRKLHTQLLQDIWISEIQTGVSVSGPGVSVSGPGVSVSRKMLEIAITKEILKINSNISPHLILELSYHLGYQASLEKIIQIFSSKGEKSLSQLLTSIKEEKEILKELRYEAEQENIIPQIQMMTAPPAVPMATASTVPMGSLSSMEQAQLSPTLLIPSQQTSQHTSSGATGGSVTPGTIVGGTDLASLLKSSLPSQKGSNIQNILKPKNTSATKPRIRNF